MYPLELGKYPLELGKAGGFSRRFSLTQMRKQVQGNKLNGFEEMQCRLLAV